MLKPLEASDGKVYQCTHRERWPPGESRLDEPFERMFARGLVNEAKYNQLKTWERVCGLRKMDESKCTTCPLALVETGRRKALVPVVPDGSLVPPNMRRLKARRGPSRRRKDEDAP